MSENVVELLFFDTFAHDNTEEINLDLVQFPKPVYVTEVRIIPLGARVQADFPGGVRLGATNPSQFQIEFFVNDLGKPGASTFETLGGFEYDQNGKINLECCPDPIARKIPTDGLVLKGVYTTITLAVYGTLTNNLTEQIIQPVVNPALPSQPNTISDVQQIISASSVESEWSQEAGNAGPIEYISQTAATYQSYGTNEPYQQEFTDYYNDIPKDPRGYHHTPETDWEAKPRIREPERGGRDVAYQSSCAERDLDRRERDRDRRYSRSDADRHEWPDSDRSHDRERSRRHDDSYRRSDRYRDEREERKRPRTPPPAQSPKRPHTPHNEQKETSPAETAERQEDGAKQEPVETKVEAVAAEVKSPLVEEPPPMDVEEFEPILSDEDIVDDGEHYQDVECDYSGYTNNDDIIRLFTPGVTEVQRYPAKAAFSINEDAFELEESLRIAIGITDDYLKSSITRFAINTFERHNAEIKEEFIHLCEKLPVTVGTAETFRDIARLHASTASTDVARLSNEDRELVAQLAFIAETVADWLRIALDYGMANAQDQPTYKIRHIKCGVRLAEWVCASDDYVQYLWRAGFNLHKELFNLYHQEFMALSIKLMILKALDAYLRHKFAIEKFLRGDARASPRENGYVDGPPADPGNGYAVLVRDLRRNPLVRLKFAIASILKKLNLFEALTKTRGVAVKLRDPARDLPADDVTLIAKSLRQVARHCCGAGLFGLSQPKRFLPVSAQFEVPRVDPGNVLVVFCRMFDLLHVFVLLLAHPATSNSPAVKAPVFELLSALGDNLDGLRYLADDPDAVNLLVKRLLSNDDDDILGDYLDASSSHLGLDLAYKLQALYHLDRLLDVGTRDVDALDVVDQLHGLTCLGFSHVGRRAVAHVLAMADNFRRVVRLFDAGKLKKNAAAAGYLVDLAHYVVVAVANVPFLEKYHRDVAHAVSSLHDDKAGEVRAHLAPFDAPVTYDNVSGYLGIVERELPDAASAPGALVSALRVLHHLGIPKHRAAPETPLAGCVELKYKHVLLQLYSLDGAALLVRLLQKICDHYQLPGFHSYALASERGARLVHVLHPAVVLLERMLAHVVRCRNVDFKDLTSIPVLLRVYNLLCAYPANCAGHATSVEARAAVADALLVYTQPVSDLVREKDSPNRTLWSQMCGEVLKYVVSAPYCFVPGLALLSELLPLPLPVQSVGDVGDAEISWTVNLRRLWSAHLHPHSAVVQAMVSRLCVSSQPQLSNLLRRVCVQIADLAANSAATVARGVLDAVRDALDASSCSASQTARLLNFLACLVTHAPIKCAVLHLIHGGGAAKTDDKYAELVPRFCRVLRLEGGGAAQAQECILSVVQSFCDVEIALTQATTAASPERYLANALPVKEHLLTYVDVMLDHLASPENSFVTYLPIVRTLLLLTEHDYGFRHLKERLAKRDRVFGTLLAKLSTNLTKTSPECLSTLDTLVEFLRVCLTVDEGDAAPLRTATLAVDEVRRLVGWSDPAHPFLSIEETLKREIETDSGFETILEGLASILKQLAGGQRDVAEAESREAAPLPPPEPLLAQFAGRLVYGNAETCDERLTARYWLALPSDEPDTELESVPCDLLEVCRLLPPEFNLVKEAERLCHVSRVADVTGKDKETAEQRCKTKKPFVTPMRPRNFTRPAQQRPDLFRSRPPNTSRPPSLHVDDFVALETCGAQPTGPTGYNKISRELLASTRMARGPRGRAFVTSERSMHYNRQMPWWGAGMFIGRGPYF
ncbi:protein virilizer [Cylas formicarius]|uniref:protein virilizer n=1 Tax=Cylas formicarius TaxID=197179 RepID=UPI0029586ACB|nr:protein virilizer [Cylas formicarius]